MSLESIYNSVQSSFKIDDSSLNTLETLFARGLTSEQKQEVIDRESLAMTQRKTPLIQAVIDGMNADVQDLNNKIQRYLQLRNLFKNLIEILPFDVLNRKNEHRFASIFGYYNGFSLALSHMISLQKECFKPTHITIPFLEYKVEWLNSVCLPLIERGIDVDAGSRMYGETNLLLCVRYYVPGISDPLNTIVDKILPITKAINRANNMGQTPLQILIQRICPAKFMLPLIQLGADVNAQGKSESFGGSVRSPLLSHCIYKGHYEALTLLLEQGADPNALPEREKYFIKGDKGNDPILTPYQLAVARDDEKAISSFVQWADRTGMPLITDIQEGSTDWESNLCNASLKKTGRQLTLSCKHELIRGEQQFLKGIFQKFGIRCYVANQNDMLNVEMALEWLATEALQSPVRKIWQPLFECFMERMRTDPNFAIYISSIPQDVIKNKFCRGFYHDNIYLETGLTVNQYKAFIAHEIAHQFDESIIRIMRSGYQPHELGEKFAAAIGKDLQKLSERDSKPMIYFIAEEIKEAYADKFNQGPLKEYFAYLLVSEVFEKHLVHPKMSEDGLLQSVREELPESFQWFETNFIQRHP